MIRPFWGIIRRARFSDDMYTCSSVEEQRFWICSIGTGAFVLFSRRIFLVVFGPMESMDDVHHHLEVPPKKVLKIWVLGKLHVYAQTGFSRHAWDWSVPYLEQIPHGRSKHDLVNCHRWGKMKALPSFLQQLSKLEQLTVAKVPLASFPVEICSGPLSHSLKNLHFQECPFTDLPEEITALQNLETLGFSEVHLKKVTPQLSQCHALRSLTIYFHRTYYWRRQIVPFQLPLFIVDIPNLESLYLSNMVMDNEEEFFQLYLERAVVVDDVVRFPFEIFGLGEHLQKGLYRQLLKNHHLPIIPYVRELDLSVCTYRYRRKVKKIFVDWNTLTWVGICSKHFRKFLESFSISEHLDLSHNALTKLPDGRWTDSIQTILLHHNICLL